MYQLFDEVGMIDGEPIKVVHLQLVTDDLGIDDSIRVGKTIKDSVVIDDFISKRVFVKLTDGTRVDSLTISDTVFAFTSKKPLLNDLVMDDKIFAKLRHII